jgi:hypothetical protein
MLADAAGVPAKETPAASALFREIHGLAFSVVLVVIEHAFQQRGVRFLASLQ